MKIQRSLVAFGLFSSCCLCAGCQPVAGTRPPAQVAQLQPTRTAPATVSALVKTLTDPQMPWAKRQSAEKALLKMPSEAVLLALVPTVAKGQPPVLMMDGMGTFLRKPEKSLWPGAQIYFATERLWAYHNQQSNRDKTHPYVSVSRALVAALPTAASQWDVLGKLWFSGHPTNWWYWTADAEKPMLALLRDPDRAAPKNAIGQIPNIRIRFLECLLDQTGMKCYAECKQVVRTWPQKSWWQMNDKAELIAALLSPDWRKKNALNIRNIDPGVLQMGFALLPTLEKSKRGHGYFLALALGARLGQNFAPNQNEAKYQGQHGLTDAYFGNTSQNALQWWRRHEKDRVVQRIAKGAISDQATASFPDVKRQ